LGVDAGAALGRQHERPVNQLPPKVQVAFKKDQAVSPATAKALANMILAAYTAFSSSAEAEGH
jgi:hypothetical protein